jgi:hypothetical protein
MPFADTGISNSYLSRIADFWRRKIKRISSANNNGFTFDAYGFKVETCYLNHW